MATYTWRATNGGAFDNSANWSPTGVPGMGDAAQLVQYGGTLSSTGSAGSLAFANATWTIVGQITGGAASIDFGTVAVDGGGNNNSQLVVTGPLAVGLAGGAALAVANGGEVVVTASASTDLGAASLGITTRGIINLNGPVVMGRNGASSNAVIDAGVLAVGGVFQLGVDRGSGNLMVQNGGEVVLTGSADASAPYLQLGAVSGSTGTATLSGVNAILVMANNSAAVGYAGNGTLNVVGGAAARFSSSNNALNPALQIGQRAGANGSVAVSGAGSSLTASGSFEVGVSGAGTLQVLNGATASSMGLAAAQAAVAVASGPGGSGNLVVDGAGSRLTASGVAVIGGDNRGAGLSGGGTGTVVLTNGGTLQTGAMTIFAGSQIALDSTSQESISGTLANNGVISTFGTFSVSDAVSGSGTLKIGAGLASVGRLAGTNVAFTSANGSLRVSALSGTSTVTGIQVGDAIDLVGQTATISGNTVTTATGALTFAASASGGQFALSSDGNGGTFVAVGATTIGVYRFFDSHYGTHFFSASSSEKNSIIATRPDLVYEGVGLSSIDPNSNDPNAAPVFRFFDSSYGTHFFTASAAERDIVIATRSDLLYEGVGFIEHTTQQPGDVAVYRFFDTHYGTHFYTADANERATVSATRPDLIDEGIGFYAPGS